MGSESGLDDVYQRLIIDHSRHPRNLGVAASATHSARGDNPFCGDAFTVSLSLSDNRIATIGFEGAGCAISTASASMMTASVKGLTRVDIAALYQRFDRLLGGAPPASLDLGDLSAFAGVSGLKVRIKCARLAWITLQAALTDTDQMVSTE